MNASRAETENFRYQYVNVLYSQSYRITAPLRFFYKVISKLRPGRHQTGSATATAASAPNPVTGTSSVYRERQEDEQYFLGLFQHEIDKRRKS